jgi:hypothetical protein
MVRSAASKVMWVGRATVFLVGLAVILALVFGVLSRAAAHSNVDNKLFHLGHSNSATTPTSLVSTLADALKSALIVQNKSGGPALELKVGNANVPANDVAPMKVNSNKVVTNLNADKVDGKSSTDFYAAGSKVADSTHADQADVAREAGIANAAGDSDTLDGKDSTQFVQGNGRALASWVNISPGTNVVVLSHSDRLPNIQVSYNCPSNMATADGTLEIKNLGDETLSMFSDNGGTDPNHERQLSQNQTFSQPASFFREHITLQVQGTSGMATIEVFSVHHNIVSQPNFCHVQAQGLFSYF